MSPRSLHSFGCSRNVKRRRLANPVVIAAMLFSWSCGGFMRADDGLEYNRDVRPILAEYCFACHGPDSAARKADLRLDQREAAIDFGAIVPGKPDESEVVARLFTDDADLVMPPRETKKSLSPAQKELLKRWVAAGAEYQPHWSFIPPERHEPPAVKNQAWAKNFID
ncbi:MAG: hypothetical protein KDA59_03695, partial [Planctomycetales bacterium]|nr:hypothetical protein [Planctomycetales bacterium]